MDHCAELHVSRWITAAGLAALLGCTPSLAQTGPSLPYRCQWVSEVTPDAVIRFRSSNGAGLYSGTLIYRGRALLPFQEGQSQGYGSHWWSSGGAGAPSGPIVVFAADQAVRGTAGFWQGRRPVGVPRLLLVGLGSALYYGSDPRWRDDQTLLTAGEGFWRLSPGCRSLL